MEQQNSGSCGGVPEGSAADRFPVSFALLALARAHRTLAAELLRELGLFVGQELMLMQLWERDGQSQNCLGQTMRLDHSTVCKSVQRLEEAGLVTRSRSEDDRRVTIVSLTPAGRDLEPKVQEVWRKLEQMTTEALTEQEQELLVALLRKATPKVD